MQKKIAVINDLSGFGRCSLVAAISAISAMGVSPYPLPTAILSAQTGYPSYYCDDYTDKMEYIRSEWEGMHASFDGIYTGFVSSEAQLHQIFRFLDTFKSDDNFLLVDPVMGGDGVPYDMFNDALLALMKQLALRADILTPNLTELCLLTDQDYNEVIHMADSHTMLEKIGRIAHSLCENGSKHVIVTGIRFTDNQGIRQMGNLSVTAGDSELIAFPYIGGSYSGTGDLFASCICAGVARGQDISSIVHLAGDFICHALHDSANEGTDRNDGVNYEKYLSLLAPEKM